MSVLVLERCSAGIMLACDGVAYDDRGIVRSIASKIFTMPELDCAFGWSGQMDFGYELRREIAVSCSSFDSLIEQLPAIAQKIHAEGVGNHTKDIENKTSIVIVGWSKNRDQLEAFRMVSYEKLSATNSETARTRLPVWTLIPIEHYFWASHQVRDEEALAKINAPGKSEEGDLAARYISACRADSGVLSDGRPYCAGGFIQIVHLQKDMVTSWVAHRWPEDEIGKTINPTSGVPFQSWLETNEVLSAVA